MIRTENLTKAYGGLRAVDSLSLTVGQGEVFGFLGPNGAGKTTTIGLMVGLIEPTAGKCYINDIDVTRRPLEAKRITGYLPDGVGFYGNLTGRQNLKYFSRFYDMKDADARVAGLLDTVGLGKVEKPVGAYSRGMKQRLGLAQALLNDPEFVFLDEPTSGLDPEGVVQFRRVIGELAGRGKTIFFSSHILNEVQHICHTIGIISRGKLVAQGTPDEVRRKMRKDDQVLIRVKVLGEMPRLGDPRIVDATYHDGSAVIRATADIRDDIAEELFQKSLRVREMTVEEKSLEEIFLDTIYRGEAI